MCPGRLGKLTNFCRQLIRPHADRRLSCDTILILMGEEFPRPDVMTHANRYVIIMTSTFLVRDRACFNNGT